MFRKPGLPLGQGKSGIFNILCLQNNSQCESQGSELFCQLPDPATMKYPVDVVTFPKEDMVWIAPINQKNRTETFHGIQQRHV